MKDDRIYLLHIRDAIQRIVEYTTPGKESFFADRKTQDAVVRNLEIIGEATKCVSSSLNCPVNKKMEQITFPVVPYTPSS